MRHPSISDRSQRHPLLDDDGHDLLRWMQEHARAPRWNYACGDQLDAEGLRRVRAYERRPPAQWGPDELPVWLRDFAERCARTVPFYRRQDAAPVDSVARFQMLDFTTRDDLHREPWSFVPDDQPLDDMIVYDTSGTIASRMLVMADPVVSSTYLPTLGRALQTHGVALQGGAGRVSLVLVGAQAATLTYATVSSYLDGAGFVKVNLNEAEWRDPSDRAAFLDELAPEVYSGDPLAFEVLAGLGLQTRPKALVSSAMSLLPGMRVRLEARFGCPVLDVYSLTECRLLAVSTPEDVSGGGWESAAAPRTLPPSGAARHRLIRPDVYVEAVDEEGRVCPPGQRGELIISGGNNPFVQLLRYRTGDFGSLRYESDGVYVEGLEGREPVVFLRPDGGRVNNIDVTHALADLPLARFALRQRRDGSLILRYAGAVDPSAVEAALRGVLGADASLAVSADLALTGGKWISYASDLAWEAMSADHPSHGP